LRRYSSCGNKRWRNSLSSTRSTSRY
jgi:hypothetical protein